MVKMIGKTEQPLLETTVSYYRVLTGILFLIVSTSPIFWQACQQQDKAEQTASETAAPPASSGAKGTAVTFSGKDGDVIREESGRGTLPQGFPEDVPLPENGRIRLSQHRVKMDTFTVVIDTKDSPEAVVRFYEQAAPREGWKVTRTTEFGPLTSVEAVKEPYRLQIEVSREGELTQIFLTRAPIDAS